MSATERARELLADALGLDLEDVSDAATMESVSVWDSLQHLSVITAIEAELAVTLTPEEVPAINSVSAIAHLIDGNRE